MDKHSRHANGVPIKQRSFREAPKKLQNMMNIFINPGQWIRVPQDRSQLEVSEPELPYLRVVIQGTWLRGPEYYYRHVVQPCEIIFLSLAKGYRNWITYVGMYTFIIRINVILKSAKVGQLAWMVNARRQTTSEGNLGQGNDRNKPACSSVWNE